MSREIKFKVYLPALGVFINNVNLLQDGSIFIIAYKLDRDFEIIDNKLIINSLELEIKITSIGSSRAIIIDSKDLNLYQYIGKYDSSGDKIFEGDIIDFNGRTIGSVIFHANLLMVCVYNGIKYTTIDMCQLKSSDIGIIGHIDTHPELLTDETKGNANK